MSNTAVEIFFSYSHRDEDSMKELVNHLSALKRQGVIRDWHDRQITAGSEWEGQIDEHLTRAQIILLFISSDFLASDYCYDIELKRAMERHEAGEARVIPVILRHVEWHGAPFAKLQSLPKDAKPINSWADRDEAFFNVAQGIRKVVAELTSSRTSGSPTSANHQPASTPLTGFQKRRLEQQRDTLQSEWNLRAEKLQELRKSWAIETSAAIKFQLQKQIQDEEAKLVQLGNELDTLDQALQ